MTISATGFMAMLVTMLVISALAAPHFKIEIEVVAAKT